MSTISSWINERYPVHMASKDSHWLNVRLTQRPPIPNFNQPIIPSTVDDMWGNIREGHTIDIIFMGRNLNFRRSKDDQDGVSNTYFHLGVWLEIIDIQTTIVCSTQKFFSVGRKHHRKYAKPSAGATKTKWLLVAAFVQRTQVYCREE